MPSALAGGPGEGHAGDCEPPLSTSRSCDRIDGCARHGKESSPRGESFRAGVCLKPFQQWLGHGWHVAAAPSGTARENLACGPKGKPPDFNREESFAGERQGESSPFEPGKGFEAGHSPTRKGRGWGRGRIRRERGDGAEPMGNCVEHPFDHPGPLRLGALAHGRRCLREHRLPLVLRNRGHVAVGEWGQRTGEYIEVRKRRLAPGRRLKASSSVGDDLAEEGPWIDRVALARSPGPAGWPAVLRIRSPSRRDFSTTALAGGPGARSWPGRRSLARKRTCAFYGHSSLRLSPREEQLLPPSPIPPSAGQEIGHGSHRYCIEEAAQE